MNPCRRILASSLAGGFSRTFGDLGGQAWLAVLLSLAGLAAVLVLIIPRSGKVKASGGDTTDGPSIQLEPKRGYAAATALPFEAAGGDITPEFQNHKP